MESAENDFIDRAEKELNRLLLEDRALAAQEEGVRRKRNALGSRIARLRDSVSTYRELMDIRTDAVPSSTLFDKPIAMGTIADMAYEIVLEHGGPMKVAELTRELEKLGKLAHGGGGESARGNYGTVYGTLNRDHRFVKVGQGAFSIKPIGGPDTAEENNQEGDEELPPGKIAADLPPHFFSR